MSIKAIPRTPLIKRLKFYIGYFWWYLRLGPAEEALKQMEREHYGKN